MNFLYFLLGNFFEEEKISIFFLIILSLIITFISTNYLSSIIADIITSVQENKAVLMYSNYQKYFIGSSILLALTYMYKSMQNRLLTKLTQWLKHHILKIILTANNENLQQVNFIEFITPITRIPTSCYVLFYDVVSVIIPTITFLFGIALYFLIYHLEIGVAFIVSNLLLCAYLSYFWESMLDEKNIFEIKINENEKIIVDILNNVDKVIYRGQTQNEIANYGIKTDEGILIGTNFLTYSTKHIMMMNLFILIIFLGTLFYLIKYRKEKKMEVKVFITLLTIMLMYRERMTQLVGNLGDYIEFLGKLNYIVDEFDKMLGSKANIKDILAKKYDEVSIPFSVIRFDDVSFRYGPDHPFVFTNLNLELGLEKKIIGITGISGKGKSSFVKMLLRLYDPTSGKIYIDDVDITTIDPNYVRENITYVNQNSKLFDKKVIDNILYGCSDIDACQTHLNNILKNGKIQKIFQNIDIENKSAGSLGENLSGGQRQIANIISGLINPSPILILDEPTNALDPELKKELLRIIQSYRDYKKCIFIITHDKDVTSLFDETLNI
jgi:ABC-type multidrug transport system fused ATPase/permease subunit